MIKNDIKTARSILQRVEDELEVEPKIGRISDLLEALWKIEEYYEEFCRGCDIDFDEPEGTTYQNGINLEFYIEAWDWHDVSVALRKFDRSEDDPSE